MVQYQYGGPEVKEASLKRIIISETQQVLQYNNNNMSPALRKCA